MDQHLFTAQDEMWNDYRIEIAELKQQNADLLAALKMVEWDRYSNTYQSESCLWCDADKPNHEDDCPRQAAIAKAEKSNEAERNDRMRN